ncbi:MAG: hypothetical protein E6J14_02070 [Chloroflexi bacterium]|nr:MAG: hypothetical protein E6J14_02070 [Chloroflexota bacterium]
MIGPGRLGSSPASSDPVSDLLGRVAEVLPAELLASLSGRLPELARAMATAVRREMTGAGLGEDLEASILDQLAIAIAAVRERRPLTADELDRLRGVGREMARRQLAVADVLTFTHASAIAGWEAARAVLSTQPGFDAAGLAELAGPLMRFVEATSVEVAATYAAESARLQEERRSLMLGFASAVFTGSAMEAELRRQARVLGVTVADRYAVCAALGAEGDGAPAPVQWELSAGPGAVGIDRERARLLAVPIGEDGSLTRVRRLARDAIELFGFDVAGIGGPVDGLADVPRAAAEAISTAQLLHRVRRHATVAAFDELLAEHILLGDRRLAERLVEAVLGRVLRARSAEELLRTLEVHLQCEASVARTASALGVHRHTVEYRLERLRDLLGEKISLASPAVVLALAGHNLLERLPPEGEERGR